MKCAQKKLIDINNLMGLKDIFILILLVLFYKLIQAFIFGFSGKVLFISINFYFNELLIIFLQSVFIGLIFRKIAKLGAVTFFIFLNLQLESIYSVTTFIWFLFAILGAIIGDYLASKAKYQNLFRNTFAFLCLYFFSKIGILLSFSLFGEQTQQLVFLRFSNNPDNLAQAQALVTTYTGISSYIIFITFTVFAGVLFYILNRKY